MTTQEILNGRTVLIIDDNIEICALMTSLLTSRKMEVYTAYTGEMGLVMFKQKQPDLVILDIMLPDVQGWEICHRLRELSTVPIIIYSALREAAAVVRGLEYGADDYIRKSTTNMEILARMSAAIRRAMQPAYLQEKNSYDDGYLLINLEQRLFQVKGKVIDLSPTEWALLNCLYAHCGQVVNYKHILDTVWGDEDKPINYIHVYLTHLRNNLEGNGEHRYLETVSRVGVRFVPKEDAVV
ncbi:MAG TPA: response regulator transcription factor [Anaerolineae bacterium]|nr:response regulator transcription factor [Anaerolineae bacterium]